MMHVAASVARLLTQRSHFAKLRTGGTKPVTSPVGSRGVPADAAVAPAARSRAKVEPRLTCRPRIFQSSNVRIGSAGQSDRAIRRPAWSFVTRPQNPARMHDLAGWRRATLPG